MSDGLDPRDYIHPDTGEVYVPKEDLENCEGELRKARRRIKSYERNRQEQRDAHRERPKIIRAIQLWAELTGHPTANTNAADRFDMVVARRKEKYSWEHISLAIVGLAANPYVTDGGRQATGKRSERHDRLGIALGKGEQLEKFANMGAYARRNGYGGVELIPDDSSTRPIRQ